jgi:hypothetical protein
MHLDPNLLPGIHALKQRAKALAMVEAIVSPEWEYRYYSYNSKWSADEEMASMRNGEGDDWFLLFAPFGVGIKGLDHETQLAGDAALLAEARTQLPHSFKPFLDEPAFSWNWMSYCYWRSHQDHAWSRLVHPNVERAVLEDGSAHFLALLHEPHMAYVEFAGWYHEQSLPHSAVEAIYRHVPLTRELIHSLNPDLSIEECIEDIREIGYPVSESIGNLG